MASAFEISALTQETLQIYRSITDPLADETITKIITSGQEKQVNDVFLALVKNDGINKDAFSSLGPELESILNNYFEATAQLPKWADQDKIKKGEQLFIDYGPEIFMLLNVSSLPMCYTCAKGAKVLYDTGRLMSHNQNIDPLARRLMETAQMIVNVMMPGGLSEKGSGIVTIQKVRLIHASIRYFLKHKSPAWDAELNGEPINQEDLAGTLMSFGPVILTGLRKLNIKISAEEEAAYMHCWKIVGYLIGIGERLLPDSYDDGFELATKILNHQAEFSEEGKQLTDSCIAFMQYLTPGNGFNSVPGYFIHFFLEDFSKASGKDLQSFLGLPDKSEHFNHLILSLTKFITGELSKLEHHQFVRKITPIFNRLILKGIIHHYNGGKNVHFNIPPSLQKDWQLVDDWKDYKVVIPNLFGNRLSWQKENQQLK